MSHLLSDRIIRDIAKFAENNHLKKVILFGSRARGTHTERSDIDLAVIGGDAMNFSADLNEKAHTLLMFDVVSMDDGISEELQRNIERDGVVIYG